MSTQLIVAASYEEDLANNFVRAHRMLGTVPAGVMVHGQQMAGFMVASDIRQNFDPSAFLLAVRRSLLSPRC